MFAYEKLHGLDRERVLAAINPILLAHRLSGVELEWKTDPRGRVLAVTLEPAEANANTLPVSIEICAEVSRDISAALDVAECIGAAYHLEVGTPGIERWLYRPEDYIRFKGRVVRLKVTEPVQGQYALSGRLVSIDAVPAQASGPSNGATAGPSNGKGVSIVLETDRGEVIVSFGNIKEGKLVYEFGRGQAPVTKRGGNGR